LQNSL
jgi:hypothetical protein